MASKVKPTQQQKGTYRFLFSSFLWWGGMAWKTRKTKQKIIWVVWEWHHESLDNLPKRIGRPVFSFITLNPSSGMHSEDKPSEYTLKLSDMSEHNTFCTL